MCLSPEGSIKGVPRNSNLPRRCPQQMIYDSEWTNTSDLLIFRETTFPENFHNIKLQSPTEIAGIILLLLVALFFLCTCLLLYWYFLLFTNKEVTLESLSNSLPLREPKLRQYNWQNWWGREKYKVLHTSNCCIYNC